MKLYFSPGACSLSPHIVAREANLELTLERVDMRTKKTASGADFLAVNPKGYVPALELDDGEVLTEGPTIVQYLADQRPDARLVGAPGTRERYRQLEMLGYINSEIHKSYSPLFKPDTLPQVQAERREYVQKRYGLIEASLEGHDFLMGDHFTVADAYLFTVTSWAPAVKLDLGAFPRIAAFQARVAARPAVVAALATERARPSKAAE